MESWRGKSSGNHLITNIYLADRFVEIDPKNQTASSLNNRQVVIVVKKLPITAGDVRDVDSIPESERSPGRWHGNPLQYSCLENPKDRGTWRATVHRIEKSQTRLKRFNTRGENRYPALSLLLIGALLLHAV